MCAVQLFCSACGGLLADRCATQFLHSSTSVSVMRCLQQRWRRSRCGFLFCASAVRRPAACCRGDMMTPEQESSTTLCSLSHSHPPDLQQAREILPRHGQQAAPQASACTPLAGQPARRPHRPLPGTAVPAAQVSAAERRVQRRLRQRQTLGCLRRPRVPSLTRAAG